MKALVRCIPICPDLLSRRIFLLAAGMACLGFVHSLKAQSAALSEEQIIAQFVYKFSKAVKPSPGSPSSADAFFTIGIWGPDAFEGYLDEISKGKSVGDNPIRITRISSLPEARSCDFVFLSLPTEESIESALSELKGSGVVRIGRREGFIKAGGIINFMLVDSKVRYELNEALAREEGIVFHSYIIKNAFSRADN